MFKELFIFGRLFRIVGEERPPISELLKDHPTPPVEPPNCIETCNGLKELQKKARETSEVIAGLGEPDGKLI